MEEGPKAPQIAAAARGRAPPRGRKLAQGGVAAAQGVDDHVVSSARFGDLFPCVDAGALDEREWRGRFG